MVNYDKNVHGAKREAARKAHEEKVKAKQDLLQETERDHA